MHGGTHKHVEHRLSQEAVLACTQRWEDSVRGMKTCFKLSNVTMLADNNEIVRGSHSSHTCLPKQQTALGPKPEQLVQSSASNAVSCC